jgi:hypothetical protein
MSAMKHAVPTPVRVGIMERRRPEEVLTLRVRHLRWFHRLWRATKRCLAVMGAMLLFGNLAFVVFPVPHLHLCLFPLSFVLGPLVALFAWQDRVLLEAAELPCPRCRAPVSIPDELGGWPARFNCNACAGMVELNDA